MEDRDLQPERLDVSVIIPTRNVAGVIGPQLDALGNQETEVPWELIVADNGSRDDTVAIARSREDRFSYLRIVDASERPSTNIARNAGVRASRGRYILFIDGDDIASPCWLDAMYAGLQTYDIVGGPVDMERLNTPRSLQWRPPFRRDRLDVGAGFLPYAIGTNLGFRRTVWDRVGGFDPAWVVGSTEIEFQWRAQLAGFRIGFAPDAVVAYRIPESPRKLFRKIWTSARSQPRLYRMFRDAGMPRGSLKTALLDWAWLVYHVPDVWRSSFQRVEWARRLAWRAGLLAGSFRWRVLYP